MTPKTTEPDKAGGVIRAWDRFWFTPADPTVLSLIRIFCGLIAFYSVLVYSLDFQEMMGPGAWQDLESRQANYREGETVRLSLSSWGFDNDPDERSAATGHPVWSIWFHVTDPTAMTALHIFFIVASFLFVFGCYTRVTGVITWFAVLSYVHRSPAALFGMDTMVVIVLLYLMIGASGAALSVDRWLARRRSQAPLPPAEPTSATNVAIRLLQIHLCIIYLSAGLSKLQGMTWWNGTAVWGTLANPEFAPMHNEMYMALLRMLGSDRPLFEISMTISSYVTLFFEISYVFLIWRPVTRRLMLAIAFLMHGCIGLFLGLNTFAMIMLVMNLAFVPPATAHRVLYKLSRGRLGRTDEPKPAPVPSAESAKAPKPGAVRQEKQHRAVASTHVQRKN
jgi:hypothetical protein